MSHKKASLSSHRNKAALSKAASYHNTELKSADFDKKPKVERALDMKGKVKMPYTAKTGFNKGRGVTRNEHVALYDLWHKNEDLQVASLPDLEFFYKILTSGARHRELTELQSMKNEEGDSLAISTNHFLRLFKRRYRPPPPAKSMTRESRIAYANSICNYHQSRNGTVFPGAYYNSKTDPPLQGAVKPADKLPRVRQIQAHSKKFKAKSQLNGNNGSVTGSDDVEMTRAQRDFLARRPQCTHPWCCGVVVPRQYSTEYGICVLSCDSRLLINHRLISGFRWIILSTEPCEGDDDCFCLGCVLTLLHSLHDSVSAINGNNGSYTNTDDHDMASPCVTRPCKTRVHFHTAAKKRPQSGAAQRKAEDTAKKATPKPLAELIKCVDDCGVTIACSVCVKPGIRYHATSAQGVRKNTVVRQAEADEREKDEGVADALLELSEKEINTPFTALGEGLCGVCVGQVASPLGDDCGVQSGVTPTALTLEENVSVSEPDFEQEPEMAAGGGTPLSVTQVERAVKSPDIAHKSAPTKVTEIAEPLLVAVVLNVPAADCAAVANQVLDADIGRPDAPVPDAHHAVPNPEANVIAGNRCEGPAEPPLDDPPDDNNALVIYDPPPGDLPGDVFDHIERRVIMVNTKLPHVRSILGRFAEAFVSLVAQIDHTPNARVVHVARRATLLRSTNATVTSPFLRIFFPGHLSLPDEAYHDYDMMVQGFYNASIERDVWTGLYDQMLTRFASTPIGQYAPGKGVYTYFLARMITSMEGHYLPGAKDFYHAPANIQTTFNTFMSVSNAIVLLHYNLVKTTGGEV